MIELAFYWSLIFTQFIDVKRKDFWQMFIHHIATITLLSFSYLINFVRVGTLVLVVHDCGDYWLEVIDEEFTFCNEYYVDFFFCSVLKWPSMRVHSDSVIQCSWYLLLFGL